MKQRIGLAAAWLAATALAVGIASQAVGLVGDRAEEVPIAVPIVGDERTALGPLTTVTTSPPTTAPPPTIDRPASTTTAPTSTIAPPAVSTTTPASVPPQTTTTPTTGTTTVTTIPPLESATFVAAGGRVTAACTGLDTIVLRGAVPASGWSAEVDDAGPEKVKVEFQSGEEQSEITLRCDEGRLNLNGHDS